MESFVLCKCSSLSLLVTAVICVQFSNAIFTTETDMVPHTLDVLHGSPHPEFGPASVAAPFSSFSEQQINSTSSRRHLENCRLSCHSKSLSDCDFTGCPWETTFLDLRNRGLWGTLPENLNTLLPNLETLWVVALPEVILKLLSKLFWSPNVVSASDVQTHTWRTDSCLTTIWVGLLTLWANFPGSSTCTLKNKPCLWISGSFDL